MDNNEFNYGSNPENNFKMKKAKNGNMAQAVVVPFVSGVVGAALVVGTCFGVPSIKNQLLNNSSSTSSTSQTVISTPNSNVEAINLSDVSNTAESVATKVLPSIVGISVKYNVRSIFGNSEAEATGSGIIISSDGYIVTNNHVISDQSSSSYYQITEATGITVNLYNDSTEYSATVVGKDDQTDLAVLKIDATGLTAATIGNSDNLKVGQYVLALGNPLGMKSSVTAGIVSAIDREVTTSDGTTYVAIQTDAAINSGNSGGALVNINGEVVGINTLKLAGSGIEGIGFAIPINSTVNIINQLIQYKTVKRPSIGISGSAVTENISKRYNIPQGVYVESVDKDSGAEKAGLKQGDIITKIEGTEVKTVQELNKVKNTKNIGDEVTLIVWSNNEEKEVKVKLGEEQSTETDSKTTENNSSSNNNNNYSIEQTPIDPYQFFFGN